LAEVIVRWEALPESIRADVLELVRTASTNE
jgi:hypothetical protein